MVPDGSRALVDRVIERRRAVALACHFREAEGMSIAQIAQRLGRSPATIKAYFYDPTGEKARAVKARYVGLCRGCGAYTQPRNGKGDAYAYCKACHPGAIERRWTRERVLAAMHTWRDRYGRLPSSYDWSRTHARRRGGEALERLVEGGWPWASVVSCGLERLDSELDTLAARATSRALKLRITGDVRDRARNGRYAFVHERGRDFAAGIWVVDPAFMLDLVHEQLREVETAPAREEAYFAGARIDDDELRDAAAEDEQRRAQARARHAQATRSNLGLGHDIRAGLIHPTDSQLRALKQIVCHLLVRHYRELIAYGAGWTDPERQQPVGDTGRHEPRLPDAIADAELQRALADPDPLRGIAQLTARWAAVFVLDPAGVTRTKALGSERMARKLRDGLPGGEGALRAAVWEFMRPMLSPALVERNRDAFVTEGDAETTVDLDGHRAASDLDELTLGDEPDAEAA